MPRRARLCLAGVPWHIVQRGNNRSACFAERRDYLVYLSLLEELAPRFGCSVHAVVLMTNHVHLLLTPDREDSAATLMKHLGQRYTQYFNRSHNRSGTLWQGRYYSCLAQTAEYVLACYRYIEMNPVRAGMVAGPAEYRWSSYRANAMGESWPLISPHEEFQRLGADQSSRQAAYRQLFRVESDPGVVEKIRSATKGNVVLGNTDFARKVEGTLGCRAVPGKSGRPRKTSASPGHGAS